MLNAQYAGTKGNKENGTVGNILTRPMKAETVLTTAEIVGGKKRHGLEDIEWPMWASPKLDGWRMLAHPTLGPVTQSFKKIPNEYVRERTDFVLGGTNLDGEINCTYEDGTVMPYNDTQSRLASFDGQPSWKFTAFDCFTHMDDDFQVRMKYADMIVHDLNHPNVEYLPHTLLYSMEDFVQFSEWCIENGYEGVVMRAPEGPYKCGRSTFNQAWMLKWKPWEDAEGIIVGIEELMHNDNEQTTSLLGLAERSSHKGNLIPSGMAGYFILDTVEWGRVRCGGGKGFTHDKRRRIWEDYVQSLNDGVSPPFFGEKVTFRYQAFGMKDKPRFPNLKGFRYD